MGNRVRTNSKNIDEEMPEGANHLPTNHVSCEEGGYLRSAKFKFTFKIKKMKVWWMEMYCGKR